MKTFLIAFLMLCTASAIAQNTIVKTKFCGYPTAQITKGAYNPAKKYSALIVLHGKGESEWTEPSATKAAQYVGYTRLFGNGIQKGYYDNTIQIDDSTIAIVPQNGFGGFEVEKGKLFMDSIFKRYNIDTNRLTIVCYSAGGAAANGILFGTSEAYLKKVAGFFMIGPVLSNAGLIANAAWEKSAKTPVWLVSCPTEGIYNDNCRTISNAINTQVPGLCEWQSIAGLSHCGSFIIPHTTLKNAAGLNFEQWRRSTWRKPVVVVAPPVVIPNKPPTIDSISFVSTLRAPLQAFSIGVVKATDPEGLPLKYSCTLISGPSTNVSFTYPSLGAAIATIMVPGTYVIRVTVTDASGAIAFKDVTLTLLPARTIYKSLYEAACDSSPAILLTIYTDGTWEETIQ